jgi:hypothetical protein
MTWKVLVTAFAAGALLVTLIVPDTADARVRHRVRHRVVHVTPPPPPYYGMPGTYYPAPPFPFFLVPGPWWVPAHP